MEEQLKHAYDEYRKAVQAERSLSEEISGRLPSAEEQEKFERMGADVAAWKARNAVLHERLKQILAELRAVESPDLAMLSVAMRELRNLASR